jgi:hypothetical protein
MFSRSERRHHVERLKETRKTYWGFGRSRAEYGPTVMNERQLGAVVQHPQTCSCFGCGNARRHFGNGKEAKTMQERSQLEAIQKIELDE